MLGSLFSVGISVPLMVPRREILQEFLSVEILIFFSLLVTEFGERLTCEFGNSSAESDRGGH